MKRLVARAAAFVCALSAAAGAAAQTSESRLINTPAETFQMTPGGVDIRTGRYVYNETDLSIGGGAASGGLVLTRTMTQNIPGHGNPFGNLSHNWDITVSELRINYDNPQLAGNDYRIFVNFQGRSQTFKARHTSVGFGYEPSAPRAMLTFTGDRASASVVYTYTAPDGSVAVFRPLGTLGSGDCSHERRCASIAQLTEPDGTVYTFAYVGSGGVAGGSVRLRSVTSSRGYALLFEGTENRVTKACVINLALGPIPSSCASGAQASSTYTYTSGTPVYNPSSPVIFFTYRLTGATGPDNATSSFSYASGMGLIRPGETNPWQTLTLGQVLDEQYVLQDIVGQQSFADGQSYAYAYGSAPTTTSNPNPTIAGGGYSHTGGGLSYTVSMPYAWPFLHGMNNPGSPCNQIWPPCQPDQPDDFQNWVYQQTPGPVRIVDALGRTTHLDYCDPIPMAQLPPNEANRCVVVPLVSFTDPEGAVTELQYDERLNVTRVTRRARPGSALAPIVTSAVFDTSHQRSQTKPLSMTDARGNVTEFSYAPEHGGLLTETGPAPSPGAARPQTRHSYAQRRAWISNGSGGYAQAATAVWLRTATSSCRTSAATGTPASPCATAGDEVLTSYDYGPDSGPNTLLPRGQAVTATDGGVATTLRTCYAYDALGRKISETQPEANLAACPGTPPATALPYTASTRYDADGRVTGTISPDPDTPGSGNPFLAVRNSYDPAGRLIRQETGTLAAWQSEAVAPSAWTGFTALRTAETSYDMMSRKTREFVREGAAGAIRTLTQYSYDPLGRLECTAIRMNPALFGAPPASACTPGTAGSQGPDRITRNVYDAAGQRLQVREGVGVTGVEAAEATWAYNLNGQITTVIDGNGNRAELRYDGHGRQDRWTFPSTTRPTAYNDATQATALATAGSVNAADFEAYSYDPNGNRTDLRKRDTRHILYAYDALNRVTGKTYPQGGATPVVHAYDLRGLQTEARYTSLTGDGVSSVYDGFGRLASSTSRIGATARTLAYQYDRNGSRTRITHPDGQYFRMDYDAANRPQDLRQNASPVLYHFSYYPHGLPLVISRGNGAANGYWYDGIQRLSMVFGNLAGPTHDVNWTYGYNPASGLSSVGRDNDIYAWTSHYAVNRAYTTNGLNQYSAAGGASFTYDANGNLTSDGSRTYSYDIENRLVTASGGVTLRYDPLGRLQEVAGPSATTRFLYDGDALVAEYDAAGTLLRRYVHGANMGADDPLLWYEGMDLTDPRYLQTDHQGSIVAISDGDGNGSINRYDEYGIPAATNTGRFQYTGQIWLPELGMYYFKARFLSPTLGRFLQTDPVGYDDQFNLYAYVGNDPVNRTDPTGQQSCPNLRETCPDIPLVARPIRERLAAAVPKPRDSNETGGQAIAHNRTGQITYRTGPAAGRGEPGTFSHNRAPEGSHTILRSHAHIRTNNNPRGAGASAERRGNNAPGTDDQDAMHNRGVGGRPIQTIGPDVTTTMFRMNRQDYLVVDSGDRTKLPDLSGQHIIVCQTDVCPPN